jgi:LPS-assembly protein
VPYCSPDPTCAGLGSGVSGSSSYIVAGVDASPLKGLTLGAKTQVDSASGQVMRAAAAGSYTIDGYRFGSSYFYGAANPTRGVNRPQQEISGTVGIPIADYWTLSGGAAWDLTANQWLEADAGLQYDDGYLLFGAHYTQTGPTNTTPDDKRFLATFYLKTPDGGAVGF